MKKFPKLKSKAILAPMSRYTDVAFRALAKRYGAGLTYTEFVSSAALVRGNKKSLQLLKLDPSEKPSAVQVFGSDEKEIIGAAKQLEERFDIIDINCGCPAWKVIKTGAGSEMLKRPEKIVSLVEKLVSAVDRPITVKLRTGIDSRHINVVEVAQMVESAGAAAITVHGRTQKQGFKGKADWDMIAKVKESVSIPVIGNGDVDSPEVFKQRLDESGIDYVMIGRAAMGNPYMFRQIDDFLKKGGYEKEDSREQFKGYLELAERHGIPLNQAKGHAMHFTKGIKGAARLRQEISGCTDTGSLAGVMEIKVCSVSPA
ncbi:MAG: tRNA dihydrouridine synthase DusB [Nanoarchaeota archaeon]|nr:tRNA dihydrouridine synthase DusB [Nanoarchaeota archaeon]